MISNNPPVINAGADLLFLRDCICVKRTGTDATGDVLTTLGSNDAVTSMETKVWLLLQNLMVLVSICIS
jgi:hypothetical protein